jgi:hypothetical protein
MHTTTAIFKDNHFKHFGIHPVTASLYGHKPSEIQEVELIIADDQTRPEATDTSKEVDYWAWWYEKEQRFSRSLIYPKYFLLNMCFPYGIRVSEEAKEGRAYRVHVKPLSNVSN